MERGHRRLAAGSEVEGWLAVGPDTDVSIERNTLSATCLVAWETGAELVIQGNTIGGCPYEKGIDIAAGNSVLIDGNDIRVDDMPPDALLGEHSGGRPAIEVVGPEGSVTIRDNELHDSAYGILVRGDGPELLIIENRIQDNGIGIAGIDDLSVLADNLIERNVTGVDIGFSVAPTLERNTIRDNGVGLSIEGNSEPTFIDNTVCGNEIPLLSPTGEGFEIPTSEVCDDDQPE